jgi:hypothetical protein
LENPGRPRGRRDHGRAHQKGAKWLPKSRVTSSAGMDGSVSRQPQKRGILASGTLWWLQWATGAESGAVNTVQSGRSVPGQNAPLPTNAKIGAFQHVARCPRSLPLLCYRFRKLLPPRPPSPGSRQDTAKTRPSHTNRSKELDPLRHRRLCSPSFPFFRARRSLRCPLRTLLTANSSQDPPCRLSKSPGCETRNARQARNG